jgi:REP element-mobilizing transposase RayT
MARPLRIEYPGAIYHVMSRGNQRQNIFRDDSDRRRFLGILGDACQKSGWQVHAYCLMPNHFHLVIETPAANLVAGMKWLLGVYTMRYNFRHKTCGHLFAGRYKAVVVDGSGNGYLHTVCDYVHLNPVRAKLVKNGSKLESYVWSSYGEYLKPAHQRGKWLRTDRLLGEKLIPRDSTAGRREFARLMEERRGEDLRTAFGPLRQGWCFGDEQFRKELLAGSHAAGPNHFGSERQERNEERALNLLTEQLRQLGWTEKTLAQLPKGDKEKVKLARLLRQETTMTLKWIAQHLSMGSWTYVSNLLGPREKME